MEKAAPDANCTGVVYTTAVYGNSVYLRMTCQNNYDAIALHDTIAAGLDGGLVQMDLVSFPLPK